MISHDPLQVILLLIAVLLIDRLIGEWPARIHPVVWMGKSVKWLRRWQPASPSRQRLYGLLIALGLPLFWASLTIGTLAMLQGWPLAQFLLSVFICKSCLALQALGTAAKNVARALEANHLDQARFALRSLCSRDARALEPPQLIEGAVSSVAENLCDSFVAPLFYALLFGLPGLVFYRVVNTLDAMVGYRDERRFIGEASARLDDLLNWLPARLSSLLLLAAGLGLGYGWRQAWQVTRQDHGKTPSPNGGWPMATLAGVLQIQLHKPGSYTLGHGPTPPNPQLVDRAWSVVQTAGYGFAASFIVLLGVWFYVGH